MKKLVTVTLVLLLALLIPQFASAKSMPGGMEYKPQYTMPQYTPPDPPQTQNDQCLGQDPQVQSEPCCGQDPIVINGELHDAEERLQDALTNYSDLSQSTYHSALGAKTFNSLRNRYELCFGFPEGPVDVNSTITISGENKSLAVYGLNLRPDTGLSTASLVEVSFPKSVLIDLSMTDVINGLSIVGAEVEIAEATITGTNAGEGIGIYLINANNSVIKNSTVAGFGIGIQFDNTVNGLVGAENEQRYSADKNIIMNNDIGINVLSSDNIKFGYNQIYDNGTVYQDAIVIGNDPLETIYEPVLVKYKDPKTQEDIAVECPGQDRRIKFDRGMGGAAQIYVIDNKGQAFEYKATCDINAEGYCYVTNLDGGCSEYPDACTIYDATCNVPLRITAILTTDSSTELMKTEFLKGPGEVIFAESEGVDVPTAPASDDEADITSGSQLSAEGGATEIAAVAAAGAKGGCMGGGSSLLPNDISSTYAPHLGAWWIIFSIAFLGSMRVAKVRARRRFSGGRNRRRRK